MRRWRPAEPATRCCWARSAARSGAIRRAAVRPEQGLLALRGGLGLFANLRPVKVYPALVGASTLKPEVVAGVDMVIVRELTGGLYFGKPQGQSGEKPHRSGVDTMAYTEGEVARLMRLAFELARGRRKKVTSVDKANVLASSRLWRTVAHEVAAEYPDVAIEDMLVDACAMYLIRRPGDFDVIATENMFGDILSDEASMLAGSMGMLPSASLGASVGAGLSRQSENAGLPDADPPLRVVRADPRQRARHRRAGDRQPAGDDPELRHAAALVAGAGGRGGRGGSRGGCGAGGWLPLPRHQDARLQAGRHGARWAMRW